MTERRHDLTNEDIAELVARARKYPCRVFDEAEIAALPSRQPKDPDAGLGAQPWQADEINRTIFSADGDEMAVVLDKATSENYDPAAIARAILAAPKAIKLARAWVEFRKGVGASMVGGPTFLHVLRQLDALASEVLAIVDGKEERS